MVATGDQVISHGALFVERDICLRNLVLAFFDRRQVLDVAGDFGVAFRLGGVLAIGVNQLAPSATWQWFIVALWGWQRGCALKQTN